VAAASGHKSCVGVAACHYSPAPQGGAFPVRRVPLGADPSLLATILLKACGRYSRSRKCLRREVAPLAEMDLLVEDYQSLSTRLKQWQAYTTSLSKATQRFDPPPPHPLDSSIFRASSMTAQLPISCQYQVFQF